MNFVFSIDIKIEFPPFVAEFSHEHLDEDLESQCWCVDGKLFALVSERTLFIYEIFIAHSDDSTNSNQPNTPQFKLICTKKLYFNAMDVAIIALSTSCETKSKNFDSSGKGSAPHHSSCNHISSEPTKQSEQEESTLNWRGYIVAVAGSDGLQLYNFCLNQQKFIVTFEFYLFILDIF